MWPSCIGASGAGMVALAIPSKPNKRKTGLACTAVRVESGEKLQACRAAQIMAGSKMVYSFDEDLLATRRLRQWYSLCGILPLLVAAAWFVFRARYSDDDHAASEPAH